MFANVGLNSIQRIENLLLFVKTVHLRMREIHSFNVPHSVLPSPTSSLIAAGKCRGRPAPDSSTPARPVQCASAHQRPR